MPLPKQVLENKSQPINGVLLGVIEEEGVCVWVGGGSKTLIQLTGCPLAAEGQYNSEYLAFKINALHLSSQVNFDSMEWV